MSETGTKNGAAEIRLNGAALTADPSGALLWPTRRTLVVADLHLEKGSAFAARGQLLPPYDTRATLERLESLDDDVEGDGSLPNRRIDADVRAVATGSCDDRHRTACRVVARAEITTRVGWPFTERRVKRDRQRLQDMLAFLETL